MNNRDCRKKEQKSVISAPRIGKKARGFTRGEKEREFRGEVFKVHWEQIEGNR